MREPTVSWKIHFFFLPHTQSFKYPNSFGIRRDFLVELDDISNIVLASKEHRAAFVDIGGNDIQNALGTRSRDTTGLLCRKIGHGRHN